jgi:deoxyinosine 3'endonuclease (endonuclease V)
MRVNHGIWRNRALGVAACFTLALSAATTGVAQEIPTAARADLDNGNGLTAAGAAVAERK